MGAVEQAKPSCGLYYFMNKEQIKTNLTPFMHRFKDIPEWREAFNLYNQEHGTTLKTTSGCGKCFTTVREWLKR